MGKELSQLPSDCETEISYEEILDETQLSLLKEEFSHLKNACYLDHGGATLYAKSQLESSMDELQSSLFSNPHSRNPSSSVTTDATDHVRQRILHHFGTTEDEYSVIFTSGATAALKLVAEAFSYNGGVFAYLEESHTSVVGMREFLINNQEPSKYSEDHFTDFNKEEKDPKTKQNVSPFTPTCPNTSNDHQYKDGKVYCVSKSSMEHLMRCDEKNANSHNQCEDCTKRQPRSDDSTRNALMAYPAQCNFSGVKYPLQWILEIQRGRLEPISNYKKFYYDHGKMIGPPSQLQRVQNNPQENDRCQTCPICESKINVETRHHKWFVMLDAASYVASNRLDLSSSPADFVALSFYKMFGWPTGLGALLVRNESAYVLGDKKYFGGGTVNISLPSVPFHVKRAKLHEKFEDGTISFLSILGVRHGLDTLANFFPSTNLIRTRTFRLAQYLYKNLHRMKYANGQEVAKIYSDSKYDSETTQGPVVTFNLLRPDGNVIGYSEMEQIAYLHDVHLRYGCFCNPGACRRHLGLTADEVLKHYESGHVCGDMRDIIDGQPTGAIRASLGYMTTKENIDFFLQLIFNCWIRPYNVQHSRLNSDHLYSPFKTVNNNHLENIGSGPRELRRMFVYPIKSCAPFEVKLAWTLGAHGLLYDREWLIVNSNGVPLTAKREPRLCLILPTIDISGRRLLLNFKGDEQSVSVPLEVSPLRMGNGVNFKAEMCSSKVCGDSVMGIDCGPEVSQWLSRVLEKPGLKLIRMSPDHHRKPRNSLDQISLANQSQFLLLSMASLRQLAKELISNRLLSSLNISTTTGANDDDGSNSEGISISSNPGDEEKENSSRNRTDTDINYDEEEKVIESLIGRFRPNFVVGESTENDFREGAYDEERWGGVQICATDFVSGGPCIRCATICMDPKTGMKSSEPFLTLSRSRGGRPFFGIHLYLHRRKGSNSDSFLKILRIGDHVQSFANEEIKNGDESLESNLAMIHNLD